MVFGVDDDARCVASSASGLITRMVWRCLRSPFVGAARPLCAANLGFQVASWSVEKSSRTRT